MSSRDFFGTLSISSLASDERSDIDDDISVQSQFELYKRLKELEEITSNFLLDKPIALSNDRDTFTEIDRDHPQQFELSIDFFDHNHVLTLSIECLPDFACRDAIEPVIQSHQFLAIKMKKTSPSMYSEGEDVNVFVPKLQNGVYVFVLTTAHGFCAGSHSLSVAIEDEDAQATSSSSSSGGRMHQPVRLSHRVSSAVRAVPVEAGRAVTGSVQANEFAYFRCCCCLLSACFHVVCCV